MTAKEFFDLVAEMRKHQNLFFRTRNSGDYHKSRELERKVDAEINRVQSLMGGSKNPAPVQGELFQ